MELAELLVVTIASLQRIMYCNVVLAELPPVTIAPLQNPRQEGLFSGSTSGMERTSGRPATLITETYTFKRKLKTHLFALSYTYNVLFLCNLLP